MRVNDPCPAELPPYPHDGATAPHGSLQNRKPFLGADGMHTSTLLEKSSQVKYGARDLNCFPTDLHAWVALWVSEHLIQDDMVRFEVSRFSPYSLAPIHHWVTYLGFLILEYTLVTVLMQLVPLDQWSAPREWKSKNAG